MKKILITLAMLSLAACSGGSTVGDSTPKATSDGNLAGLDGGGTTISKVINLVSCPSNGYKYFNWATLAEDVIKQPGPAMEAAGYPSVAGNFKEMFSFTSNASDLRIIKKDGTEIVCHLPNAITDAQISPDFSKQSLAVATSGSLMMVSISDILNASDDALCDKFTAFKDAGGVWSIALAASPDMTASVQKEEAKIPAEVTLSLNKSVNQLPPGYKFSSDMGHILADYAYILAQNNSVYRIKPSMLGGGCVEFMWSGAEPARKIAIENSELVVRDAGGTELARISLGK